MNHIEQARKLRPLVVKAAQSLDDKDASEAVALFDGMRYDGSLIKAGTRVNWNGTLKQAAVDLWDEDRNNPDKSPDLWVDIKYREGIRIIPSPITVTEKFSEGEQGWWDDDVYESIVNDNVYTPDQYAPNWKFIRSA